MHELTIKIVEALKPDEGLSLTVYSDRENPCIGWGHNLTKDKTLMEAFKALPLFLGHMRITRKLADQLLIEDVESFIMEVQDALPEWNLWENEARRIVFVCLAFQLGMSGVLGFRRFIRNIKGGHWEDAADELLWRDGRTKLEPSDYFKEMRGGRCVKYAQCIRLGNLEPLNAGNTI